MMECESSTIKKTMVRAGDGQIVPTPGCKIAMHYSCSLMTGVEIDSSRGEHVSEVDGMVVRKSARPLMFNLGDGSQIEAPRLNHDCNDRWLTIWRGLSSP